MLEKNPQIIGQLVKIEKDAGERVRNFPSLICLFSLFFFFFFFYFQLLIHLIELFSFYWTKFSWKLDNVFHVTQLLKSADGKTEKNKFLSFF